MILFERARHPGRRHQQQVGAAVGEALDEAREAKVVADDNRSREAVHLKYRWLLGAGQDRIRLPLAEGVIKVPLAISSDEATSRIEYYGCVVDTGLTRDR